MLRKRLQCYNVAYNATTAATDNINRGSPTCYELRVVPERNLVAPYPATSVPDIACNKQAAQQ
eukprot:1184047-Rhodomonas_salina.1